MHEVLVNRLGGLSLPRKSVVRLTDRPDMTLDVYRGGKTTVQPTNFHRAQVVFIYKYSLLTIVSEGRPTIWMIVGQGPIALAVGAGRGCLDIFSLVYHFSPLSPSLWETARYRLKYCLKGR